MYFDKNRNDSSRVPLIFRNVGQNPQETILRGTPLQDDGIWNRINSNQPYKIAHMSDALRLAIVYRYE